MRLVKIDLLRPIENHSDSRVKNMKEKMLKNSLWIRPISVEKNNMLILDGHHRFNVAKKLGFKYIPSELFDYKDQNVSVWSLRKDCIVTKELVIKNAKSGNIYPYKTAKHKFPSLVGKCLLPLIEISRHDIFDDDIIDYKPMDIE